MSRSFAVDESKGIYRNRFFRDVNPFFYFFVNRNCENVSKKLVIFYKFIIMEYGFCCNGGSVTMSTLANTNVYDYVNVLDKAADASWLRNDAISNNIANADTPGYKRQDVNFETQLAKALRHSRYKTTDARVADLKTNRLKPITYTDYAGYSYRIDGNNVDPDTEGAYLAKNQIVYQGLTESIKAEFQNLKAVIK